jgi:cytochrome P450
MADDKSTLAPTPDPTPDSAPPPDPDTSPVNIFTPDFAAEPQPTYRRLVTHHPVTRAALTNGAVISRYEDVVSSLRQPEIFSSEMDLHLALGNSRPMIPQQIDPPEQTKFRKILDPRFSRKRMAEIEPRVRKHANELIDAVVDKGECEFDAAFAIPLPCSAFLGLMGLPQEELPLFLEFKDGIIRPQMQTTEIEEAQKIRVATAKRIYEYFEKLTAERKARPQDDLMSYLISAEVDGHVLTTEDILDICFLLLLAGLDTVTATLGCNVAYLAKNPDKRRSIVERPELIDGMVEELLRWETPVTAVPRVLKQAVTLEGMEMSAGEMVTLLLGAANVDDAEFGNANEVDFERARNRHLAFGGGAHRCLGSHLARMEMRIALEEWHRRIPDYAIKPGETPIYSPGIREVQYLPLVWNTSG